MSRRKTVRGAGIVGVGLGLCLLGAPAQAGATSQGSVKAATKAADSHPAANQIHVKIRPPQVSAVPPAPPKEPVLLPVAIEEDVAAARSAKIVPVRAYARDGASFYQNGQLIKVQGLDEGALGGEHAKQRLQQLLDGGQVSVSPVGEFAGGGMLAVVRVNGRDVAEAMDSN